MAYFLLTWDCKPSELSWIESEVTKCAHHGQVSFRWSCGNTQRIQQGDRLFFLRQRMEPRGIIGIGYVERGPYLAPHWNPDREARGEKALYVDAVWEHLFVEPVIARTQLDRPPF